MVIPDVEMKTILHCAMQRLEEIIDGVYNSDDTRVREKAYEDCNRVTSMAMSSPEELLKMAAQIDRYVEGASRFSKVIYISGLPQEPEVNEGFCTSYGILKGS